MSPTATDDDVTAVTRLLGRPPQGQFDVVVRDPAGQPVVIRNAPLLGDGTPMPTRYWLVDAELRRLVSGIESAGGVRAAEAAVDPVELDRAHRRHQAERDRALPPGHTGPRPSGGVGGTRKGVKCLHAHYAWHLAGGDDPVGRWVSARLAELLADPPSDVRLERGMTVGGRRAAIDCGTNSTRLLVVDADGTALERRMRITRLGQGVDASGRLAPEAVERTVGVLTEYRAVVDRLEVDRVRMAATSAARDAANRDDFFDRAEAVVGVRPELLGGDEEARLSFLGATAELDPAGGPFLVVDIGGGSTEFAVGKPDPQSSGPDGVVSVDIGCVRVTEKFLPSDPHAPEELTNALTVVRDYLDDITRDLPAAAEAKVLVGLAGTVTTVAAVEVGIDYDRDAIHHFHLTRDAVEDVFRTLATETRAQRVHNPGLEAGRADVIVGGVVILVAIMRYFGFDDCLVSEADILDGLVLSLLDR